MRPHQLKIHAYFQVGDVTEINNVDSDGLHLGGPFDIVVMS